MALANIDIIENEGLVQRAAEMGNRLLEGLHTLDDLDGVGEVRGLGLMTAVELVADKASKAPFPGRCQGGSAVCTGRWCNAACSPACGARSSAWRRRW